MAIFKDGVTAYSNSGTNILTGTTNPTPPTGFSDHNYNATAGQLAYRMWLLPDDASWTFRHPVWINTEAATDVDMFVLRTGADAGNALIVRLQGTSKMRVVGSQQDATSGFAFTSATNFPLSAWYLLQGYGNGFNNTARIALCDYTTGNPLSGFDTGATQIAVPQGGVPTGAVRFGKTSASSAWAGRVAWRGTEVRTGTDATGAFIGPYTTTNNPPTGTITTPDTAVQNGPIELRATHADSGGTVVSAVWSVPSYPPAAAQPTIVNNGSVTTAYCTVYVPGEYVVRLTLTDNGGATTTLNKTVTVDEVATPSRGIYLGNGEYR